MALNQATALDELYKRVELVAVTMKGRVYRDVEHLSYYGAMSPPGTSPGEDVPTLRVFMPNGFEVKFGPMHPLIIPGKAFVVQAKRTFKGERTNDRSFTFEPTLGWTYGAVPLSDDAIRSCLTHDGP